MSDQPRQIAADVELALDRANGRLLARLQVLEGRLEAGDEGAWEHYLTTVRALVVLARDRPAGRLLTTQELAQRLGVSTKTVWRAKRSGALVPALERGRTIRWAADSVPRGTGHGTAPSGAANDARGSSLSRAVRGGRRQ